MSVCCKCCLLSGRGLCDELITRPEESYRLWCVVVCDLETSRMGAPYIYIYMTLVAQGLTIVPHWHVCCLVLKQRQMHYSYSAVSPTTKWRVLLCCKTHSLLCIHARVHYKTVYYIVFYCWSSVWDFLCFTFLKPQILK